MRNRLSPDLGFGRGWPLFFTMGWLMILTSAPAQTVARWTGGSGDWSETAHWDIGVVPKNAGATTYAAVLDVAGDVTITVTNPVTVSGLVNRELLRAEGQGNLAVSGSISNSASITAAGGQFQFSGATIENTGGAIVADAGTITLQSSSVRGGNLRVTDNAASQVRFSGDVTLTGAAWVDDGAGLFTVYNSNARLLGDYEHGLPAGCTLVVWAYHSYQEARFTVPAGDYLNNGTIELRQSGGGWPGRPKLHWAGSGSLLGSGELLFNYSGNSENERPQITGETNAVLTIGASQWVHGQGDIRVSVVNLGLVEADRAERALMVGGVFENRGVLGAVGEGRLYLQAGFTNQGTLNLDTNGWITISGGASTDRDLVARHGAWIMFENAAVNLQGKNLVADGGGVLLTSSAVTNGKLRVTDNSASEVRFSGDVTLVGVPWVDDGAGEFRLYNSSARLLGDYEHGLPAGCTLVVWAYHSYQEARFTVPAGDYLNNGMIELRQSGGGWPGRPKLHWAGSGSLSGSGELLFNYGNNNANERPQVTGETNAVLTVGASQWVHGQGEIQMPVVNLGLIEADRSERALVLGESLENRGVLGAVGEGRLYLEAGLTNQGTLDLDTNSWITINGGASTDRDLVARHGAWIMFENAAVNLQNKNLVADGGGVLVTSSAVTNGKLRVTDNPASEVRFSGDVTLVGVPWVDDGAGEFRLYNSSARLLGDYEHGLPAGYTLVVWAYHSYQEARFTVPAGDYLNNGMIELRQSGGGWPGRPKLHWEGSGSLLGSGELLFNYSGNSENERPQITGETNTVLTIGASQWVHGQGEIRLPVVNLGAVESDRADRPLVFNGPVENRGLIGGIGARVVFQTGFTNAGFLNIESNSWFTFSGPVTSETDLISPPGAMLVFENAALELAGKSLVADRGSVLLSSSSVSHGKLRVTDSAASQARFSGDVTLEGVSWLDDGAGEFMIYNTTARLLGDFEHGLPAGATLVVWSHQSYSEVRLTMPAGVYQNDGFIELRQSGGGWPGRPTLHWAGSGSLQGNGEVFLNYGGNSDTERPIISGDAGTLLAVGSSQWLHGQGYLDLPVTNEGTIEADRSDRPLILTEQVLNEGVLRASSGGKLVLLKGLKNLGLLEADNSTIDISGSVYLGASGEFSTSGTGKIYLGRHLRGNASSLGAVTQSAAIVFDGGGIASPDLEGAAFFVEAEDFNYDRGQYDASANQMPYLGGAYQLRGGRDRIDYHQTDDRVASDLYRLGEGPSVNVNIYALADFDRGSYSLTNNYKVGYNDPGDWYNYTRVVPSTGGPFYFFARAASGSKGPALQVDEITGPAMTTSQMLQKLGEIRGAATGDNNRFAYFQLNDGSGQPLELTWSGQKTFRVTILDGGNEDLDAYVFASAVASGPEQLVEVMEPDLGPDTAGFNALSFASLNVTGGSRVRLIDQVDNAAGSAPEAVYIKNLTVASGAYLDLRLSLYAQQATINGAVTNGTVQQVTGERPALAIVRLGNNVQLSWPTTATGYALQSAPAISAGAQWVAVPGTPTQAGGAYVLTVPISAQNTFYRLAR